MNIKQKTLGGIGLLIAAFAVVSVVFAQDAMQGKDAMMHKDTTMPSSMMMMHPPKPMVLTVSASGHGLLRGVVKSVTTSSISVAAWGGIWTVNITNNTIVTPSSGLSAIAAGDFVGVSGSVSEDSPTINADYVRDWSAKAAMMKSDHMMGATTSDSMMHHKIRDGFINSFYKAAAQLERILQQRLFRARLLDRIFARRCIAANGSHSFLS